MTDAPKKYLSLISGNAIAKRQIRFKCPLTTKYMYGREWEKERIDGTQDFRNRARVVAMWAMRDGQIASIEEVNNEVDECYEAIKEAEKEERNKPLLNPEWIEWNDAKPKKEKKTKEKKKDCNRYEQLEQKNKEYKQYIENKEDEMEELEEYNERLNNEIERLKEENKELKELAKKPKTNVVLNTVVNKVKELEQELEKEQQKSQDLKELNQQLVKDIKECGFKEGVNEKELKEEIERLKKMLEEATKPKEKKKRGRPCKVKEEDSLDTVD